MSVGAIVYTSNTGFTRQYAYMLSKATSLPVYSLAEAKRNLQGGTEIVYLGWVMASSVRGYNQAVQRFEVKIVVGVCLGESGSQLAEIRKVTAIRDDIRLFTLQGGFDMKRLKGINKLIMKVVRKKITATIEARQEKSASDKRVLDMLWNGGSAVSEQSLQDVIALMQKQE